MTPEERAAAIVVVVELLECDGHFLSFDVAKLRTGVADAIRAAESEAEERGRAEEREACAKVAEETQIIGAMGIVLCSGRQIASAIRARRNA